MLALPSYLYSPTISVALIHDGSLNGNPMCWGWAIVGIVEARQAAPREIPKI